MTSFRAALSQLALLNVPGVRNNYDIHNLPNSLATAQLPALLVLPIELERQRLFQQRQDSLRATAFSGVALSANYSLTHLLLLAPANAGLGIRSHLPPLIDLIDNYTAAIAADITLDNLLLTPTRLAIEPGSFNYGDRQFHGCAFRHLWQLNL